MTGQLGLFGHHDAPRIDRRFGAIERIELDRGAWVDVGRGWLDGHEQMFDFLMKNVAWKAENRVMYEKTLEVPRRFAVLEEGVALHPILADMRTALDARYRTSFDRLSVALYRDGRDSVAWHGDYVARNMYEALVATISVGAPRKFMLRPSGGGKSISMSLGWGDLVVMGGTCQRTWQHAIPKVAHADPRIAIMFRPAWDEKTSR